MRYTELLNEFDVQEEAASAYRVRFWDRASGETAENLTEYRLLEVDDVFEVLNWVEAHANKRRSELFIERRELFSSPAGLEQQTVLIRLTSFQSRHASVNLIAFN